MVREDSYSDDAPVREESLLERLAETVGMDANVSAVYGTPVERDGVTIIPVARIRYGFGGGEGAGGDAMRTGAGGGGGVMASPMGYIEMRDGGAKFRPIRNPLSIASLILAGGLSGVLLMRGVRRLKEKANQEE